MPVCGATGGAPWLSLLRAARCLDIRERTIPTHTNAMRRRVNSTQPTPIPAFAPVERPLDLEEDFA